MSNRPGPSVPLRLAAGLLCAAPALWVMWPVLLAPHAAVPGQGFGDNVAALWNVWWFTGSAHVTGWPYWTPLLFAPFGTQLSLHTHATTHSLLAWPGAWLYSVVSSHNLALTAGLVLNGACTFLLAFRATRRLLPAVAAGLLFSAAASVQVRVLGHINLVHAWVLPMFALALTHFMARPGNGRAVLLGAAGAVVAYTDYYYAVYAILLAAAWTAVRLFTVSTRRRPARAGRLTSVLMGLLLLDLAVIATIAVTGGSALSLGPWSVSLRGLRNPLTLFWLVLAVWALLRYPLTVTARWRGGRPPLRDAAHALTAAAVFMALTLPLMIPLLQVVGSGGYATQRVLWRSSPAGGDLLTLVLGHPRHVLTGEWTASVYSTLGIDLMEQSLWLGLLPFVLLAVVREWRHTADAHRWIVAGVLFAVLALGPFLRVGGLDTALPLPDALLRYLPVFSNARIPGRAIVVVQLAIAMLVALALARKSNRVCAVILALLLFETLPAQAPLQVLPAPDAVDEALRRSTGLGAVAELPMGVRDGFGEAGQLDHRALVHQTHHGRPIAGGFVARLSPAVRRAYLNTPVLQELLSISTPSAADAGLTAGSAERAADVGIGFLVVNRDTFVDLRLPRAALERAGFHFLEAAGARELYSTRARLPSR